MRNEDKYNTIKSEDVVPKKQVNLALHAIELRFWILVLDTLNCKFTSGGR